MQDLISRIIELRDRFQKAWTLVKVDKKREKIIVLQNEMSQEGFWDDQDLAAATAREASSLEEEVQSWEAVKNEIKDLLEITELDKDDRSVNLRKEVTTQITSLEQKFNVLEFDLLFRGKHDHENVIMAIHAGAGGTDAQDWAEMLLRMYLRFTEQQNWKTRIITISSGTEAGIKSVLLEVKGKNVYGYLKAETGVHRLVRISPFDAEKMRHTSFALVEVLPLNEEEIEIDIKSDDLRIDTYRASGHGGQGVNTTDSAVRITHLPTKIVVSCQNERSQQQNKDTAMQVLKSKLQKYYETEVEEERQKLRGEYTEAAWGNQARSYVLHPYKMVKDHRTSFETVEVGKVLDGDLLEFIESYLREQVK
jgi:peptide chain release factor 2